MKAVFLGYTLPTMEGSANRGGTAPRPDPPQVGPLWTRPPRARYFPAQFLTGHQTLMPQDLRGHPKPCQWRHQDRILLVVLGLLPGRPDALGLQELDTPLLRS